VKHISGKKQPLTAARVQCQRLSVLTIDTNPARAFTGSSRKAASSQILLPGRQALGYEAEEFGVAAPRKIGQGHGLKQSKSVRTRYLDNLAVRGREQQLLKRIERRPAIATGVGFNDQAAEEST
jgi:hypothetical protein